jgi:hypothetical protein
MMRTGLRTWAVTCCVAVLVLFWRTPSKAISLDREGDIKLGFRTYVNARVGTENTHDGPVLDPSKGDFDRGKLTLGTFPHSEGGHLRQNRLFIEAEINHDLNRLMKQGVGPLSLLNDLPFKVRNLAYHITFRGEGEGLYNWGPREYSSASDFEKVVKATAPLVLVQSQGTIVQGQGFVDAAHERSKLRKLGTDRERVFQAYVEANVGKLFMRAGRQILSWGETDVFQLLDHINPLDNSFGGFLIPLDERRVPLDMLLGNYLIGDFGPISEMYLEGYAAIDDKVGFFPGALPGAAWSLPNLSAPENNLEAVIQPPPRNINHTRGGFLLKFNAFDATFSLAHYYTYFDIPAVQLVTNPKIPGVQHSGLLLAFPGRLPCPKAPPNSGEIDPANNTCGFPVRDFQTAPKVQVSGVSTTFAVPQYYSVVRSEVAYFKDEPSFTQGQLDPYAFNPLLGKPLFPERSTTGGRRLRDSFNAVVGLDANQWIRALNANQTFTISTQFFYKHIIGGGNGHLYLADGKTPDPGREVLPITINDIANVRTLSTQLEPILVGQPINQYLQTLFIGTSYRSGTINPGFTMYYDWGGALLYQPGIMFSRDPFRFAIDFTVVDAHMYKGGSGVSLLKDRDNVQFRLEYVI